MNREIEGIKYIYMQEVLFFLQVVGFQWELFWLIVLFLQA